MNKKEIEKSILCYTTTTRDCQKMKMLMDPLEYLEWLGKKDNTLEFSTMNKDFMNFLEMSLFDIEENFEYEERIDFIKDEEELKIFLQHIQNLLFQSYMNYEDKNKRLPSKLYRLISKKELEYLKKTRTISTFWSTTSDIDTAIGFATETANDKEQFLLEFSTKGKIPFIDVDRDAKTVFEPNEFILVPPFKISNLSLKKKEKPSPFGLYTIDNIPIYTANFKPINNDILEDVNLQKMDTFFNGVIKNFIIYKDSIAMYLNKEQDKNLFHEQGYRMWANNLKEYIHLQQNYIHNCVINRKNPEKIIKKA